MEGLGDEALGKAAVRERERGKHDLAGGIVKVGVGYERAEAEDFAGTVFGGSDAGGLDQIESVVVLEASARESDVPRCLGAC